MSKTLDAKKRKNLISELKNEKNRKHDGRIRVLFLLGDDWKYKKDQFKIEHKCNENGYWAY